MTIYRATTEERKEVVVTVNAGHGTSGGSSVKTLCHPDGSPKVTGGSTGEGATKATAVASGTTMLDGTAESKVTLSLAMIVKETLLRNGYDVLMIRETDDAQIDNVARTVYANNCSDCHIALHYNSTTNDAGLFYLGVPDIASYKQMEPVASHWEEHNEFGAALLEGAKAEGVKIFGSGFMGMDLTQTSYSTVPSTDLEVGDRGSDYSPEAQQKIADGILAGLDIWMKQNAAKE
ncbi:MAG: N-acetylmuramoyl-L-alanine amidase [bacterium]|nr:N-acetylmuramoyl-L-alanine amidase [bacterium]